LGDDNDDLDVDSFNKLADPYVRKRSERARNNEFRTIAVGPEDLLKEG